MKQFFRLVSMLAVAGLTFAYTSCTDYSEDINNLDDKLSSRIDDVEKQVKSNSEAITALQDAKTKAEAAIAALQTAVSDLQTKHDADVDAINSTIKALQGDVTDITARVKAIEDKLPSYATLEYVNATFATKEQMTNANTEIGKLQSRLDIAEAQLKTVSDKYDSDLKITEIIDKIDAAKAAADDAQTTASDALGKVETLTKALGVYAEEGKLGAKIEALEKTDTDLDAAIKNLDKVKLNISDFDKMFDQAIEKSCKEGGKVYESIFKPLDEKISQVANKLSEVEKDLNAKISAIWTAFNTELRSLVFVPNLYVDGIEAVEYVYGGFYSYSFANAETPYVGTTLDKRSYTYSNEVKSYEAVRVNPAVAVEYEMNPSSAVLTADNALKVLSRDVESVSTRAEAAAAYEAEFVETKDGNLIVNLKSNKTIVPNKEVGPTTPTAIDSITVFALQATVRKGDKDTTITSDYARIYESRFHVDAISYINNQYGHSQNACKYNQPTNHLFNNTKGAIENSYELTVDYKKTLDIKKLIQTHYYIVSRTSKSSSKNDTYYDGVYEEDYPNNDYGLSYKFELVDYYLDGDKASESSFATIDPVTGVLTPRVNGEVSPATIDRQPLVRVSLVTKDGAVVSYGYIKVLIKPEDYIKSDEYKFEHTIVSCQNFVANITSIDKVYGAVEIENEVEFKNVYALQYVAGNAVQYKLGKDNKFTKVAATDALGKVTETVDKDGKSQLEIAFTPEEISKIYKMDGHSTTIWLRYVFVRNANADSVGDEFEGVYVPVRIVLSKNAAGTVGVKLSNYWFDNEYKAILNVKVPNAEPNQPVPAVWTTPINQVWVGNEPVFTVAGKEVENPVYKYYFAPKQTSIDGVQLTVASKEIFDLYDDSNFTVDNDNIAEIENKFSADYTKGIYANDKLYANGVVIATIDQKNGTVTFENNETAKKLLNATASVPKSAAELYANIGVVLKSSADDCDVVTALSSQVNPYYFLRPLNLKAEPGEEFIDGADANTADANIDLLNVLSFTDWRGESGKFVTPEFDHLWYFMYYNVSNIKFDFDNVTTTLQNGDLDNTKLSTVTKDIVLSHCTGAYSEREVVPATGLKITYTGTIAPGQLKSQAGYDRLVKKLGYLHYQNNGNNVETSFMLRLPVEVTYTWGVIKTKLDVTVNPTR